METQLLKQLLDVGFYERNKSNLTPSLFDDDALELYEVIVDSHNKYGADLSYDELTQLWQDKNPTSTTAQKRNMDAYIDEIKHEELINQDIASDLLHNLWKRDLGKRIANLGLNMAQGKDGSYDKLRLLIEQSSGGVMPTDFDEDITTDIDKLLELNDDTHRFRFNINSLSKVCGGIGRQEFGIIFARPETGKTALSISLPFAPGGYCDQGFRVAYIGNEESVERTMLRAYSSWTGMDKRELHNAPKLAQQRFEEIRDKVHMQSCMGWDVNKVEAYFEKVGADVGIIDQADKIGIEGSFDSDHQRLRSLYTNLREIPKRSNSALWGVSQASNDAEGKTVITPDMMEGSKTGKYAEADIILGVGKYKEEQDNPDDPIRFITFGKNKISGYHGTIPVKLERFISRYVD